MAAAILSLSMAAVVELSFRHMAVVVPCTAAASIARAIMSLSDSTNQNIHDNTSVQTIVVVALAAFVSVVVSYRAEVQSRLYYVQRRKAMLKTKRLKEENCMWPDDLDFFFILSWPSYSTQHQILA